MWSHSLMLNFLTEEQVKVLRQAHRTIKDKRLADRVKAILSLNSGFEYTQVAQILLLDEVTIRRYIQRFQEKGIDGLLEFRYLGRQAKLNSAQEQELTTYLKEHTKRISKEVVEYILRRYGVKFSVIGATKLLHRLGFSYKKPKVIPGKADRIKQEQFLQTYQEIKTSLGLNDQIYFGDATHPEHNTKPSYGWILRGKDHDKFVKSNTGRERLNLNGVLSLKTHTALVLEEATINSEATIRLLDKLGQAQPKGKIYLILDNARYHHSKLVQVWIKRHRRFKLIFLPPYSPNLNLIERLWRFFHLTVTWNHYFETIEQFRKTTLEFFNNLSNYQTELNTLLTDNFQLVPT